MASPYREGLITHWAAMRGFKLRHAFPPLLGFVGAILTHRWLLADNASSVESWVGPDPAHPERSRGRKTRYELKPVPDTQQGFETAGRRQEA